MLRSMTAYARASKDSLFGRIVVQISSLNRRHLEVVVNLPREFNIFDTDIKKWVTAQIGRGQVSVDISVSFKEEGPIKVTPNLLLVRQLKKAWEGIASEVGAPLAQAADLTLYVGQENLLTFQQDLVQEDLYRKSLRDVVSEALQQFVVMKVKEGTTLQEDILSRLEKLRSYIRLVSEKCIHTPEKYRQKLLARLQELVPTAMDHEERMLREVAIYSERVDISEEVTRFFSHLDQLEEVLRGQETTVGKKVDFLIQEINREANTIGSKSSEVEIARLVVEAKTELERIREQIQNVE